MDKGAKNKVILEATGLKQTQLTYYKGVIRNGYIEDLKDGVGVKELFKKASLGQSGKKHADVQTSDNKGQTPILNSTMIEAIENESGESDGFVKYDDIPDYISYDPPKVKLDEPEFGPKSRNPDEG